MPTVNINDLELFYQIRGNEDGEETVLALHPSTVNGTMFTWAIPRQDRYRVILPDQRGHGKTSNPASDYHLSRFIDDMVAFIDTLETDRLHVMGYSLGGGVALGLCSRIPERIKSVLLIGVSHIAPDEEQKTAIAGPPEEREGLVKKLFDSEIGTRAGWEFDLEDLDKIEERASLIVGDRDPVVKLEDALTLYQAFPDGELFVLPQANHFDYHTSDLVKQYIDLFFESL